MWLFMIIFHAAAGVISFITGIFLLSPKRAIKYPFVFPIYLLSLIGLIVFMIGAMIAHWTEISMTEQILFSGLVILGLYMFYRATEARRLLAMKQQYQGKYIDAIGFTLISLFDGFVIVGAIDLKFPVWGVIIGAVAAIFLGNILIERAKGIYINSGRKEL